MPEDGWSKRVEQLSLGFQLYLREPEVPTLGVVVGCAVAGVVLRLTNRRNEDGSRHTSRERRDQMLMRIWVGQQEPWCFVLGH